LVLRFDHCHILHVVVVVYEEIARKTRGFRDESFDPLRDKIFSLMETPSIQDSLGMGVTWCQVVIEGFLSMREYRAAVHFCQVLDELFSAR
jgi:hypothetical protein